MKSKIFDKGRSIIISSFNAISSKRKVIKLTLALLFLFIWGFNKLFPIPLEINYSKVIYSNNNTMLAAYLTKDDKWRLYTKIEEVSPELLKAIIEKEDKWFYWHPGINPIAIGRAFLQNIYSGKRVSGASTISMQVVRMLEPSERTYFNKIKEIFRAMQLELVCSKREILELYLSLLPYGGNVEGVKAASYIYFDRSPDKLNLSQSIILTIIPNNPNNLRIDKNNTNLIKNRNKWIDYYLAKKKFSKNDLNDAREESVNSARYSINISAPHFSNFIKSKYKNTEIFTTLDISKQLIAEKLLSNYIEKVKIKGISNGAVLVVNNKDNSVEVYCGSENYYNNINSGQVNAINAIRSPGSALKPFLYSHAFDIGILTPKMIIYDIPTDFSGYEPENFDLVFNGPVTVDFALKNSLNIPAVKLLENIGLSNFIDLLNKGGFYDIVKMKNKLGLSMILGGCGVRMEQLTRLYTALARNGNLYKLKYLKDDANDNYVKVFSPDAAFLTSAILSSNQRPDFPADFINYTKLPRVAWKTGTSYGKRDAWAVGYNPDYTIAVWMGNFDGKGANELTGANIAVPLLFELFNAINYNANTEWFKMPDNTFEREVCSETGLLPSENCVHLTKDYYIENISLNKKCELKKTIYTDLSEKIQYCPSCLPESGYKKVNYPFYEPELTLWYLKNKIDIKTPPAHNPDCNIIKSGKAPIIVSPVSDYEYFIEKDTDQQIMLQAASEPSVKYHYWYIDNKFIAKTKAGESHFYIPKKGNNNISCMDDLGRVKAISVKVVYY